MTAPTLIIGLGGIGSEIVGMVETIFMNKTLTDGAGQVRAISRLALEHAMSQEMLKPLE